jgi:hypothetical protein
MTLISSKDTGPEMFVVTTPTGGVARAILKATTVKAQPQQSDPSINFALVLVIAGISIEEPVCVLVKRTSIPARRPSAGVMPGR